MYRSRPWRDNSEINQAQWVSIGFTWFAMFVFAGILVLVAVLASSKNASPDASKRSPPPVKTMPDGSICGVVESHLNISEGFNPTYGFFKLARDENRRVFKTYAPRLGISSQLVENDMQVIVKVEPEPDHSDGCWVVTCLERVRPAACRPKEDREGRLTGTVDCRTNVVENGKLVHCFFQLVGDQRVFSTCSSRLGVGSQLIEKNMEVVLKAGPEPDHDGGLVVSEFEPVVKPPIPEAEENVLIAQRKPKGSIAMGKR